MSDKQKRYVGLDVHKHYVMVGAVNRTQEMVLPTICSNHSWPGWWSAIRRKSS
jgi:hypothetical protein